MPTTVLLTHEVAVDHVEHDCGARCAQLCNAPEDLLVHFSRKVVGEPLKNPAAWHGRIKAVLVQQVCPIGLRCVAVLLGGMLEINWDDDTVAECALLRPQQRLQQRLLDVEEGRLVKFEVGDALREGEPNSPRVHACAQVYDLPDTPLLTGLQDDVVHEARAAHGDRGGPSAEVEALFACQHLGEAVLEHVVVPPVFLGTLRSNPARSGRHWIAYLPPPRAPAVRRPVRGDGGL
mmetsp:Transcript_41240/g.119227  ORF Transcript_41240/g.119227 Transcript_41240/m.119227 type:complete len:234 (+) Transcript_41240:357-1058(+)